MLGSFMFPPILTSQYYIYELCIEHSMWLCTDLLKVLQRCSMFETQHHLLILSMHPGLFLTHVCPEVQSGYFLWNKTQTILRLFSFSSKKKKHKNCSKIRDTHSLHIISVCGSSVKIICSLSLWNRKVFIGWEYFYGPSSGNVWLRSVDSPKHQSGAIWTQ